MVELKSYRVLNGQPVVLTRAAVEREFEEPGFYWDSKIPGFCLKVTATGKKTYIVKKKLSGNRAKVVTFTIGATDEVSLDQAKSSAKQIIGQLAQGIDPNEPRRELAEEVRIQQVERKIEKVTKELTLEAIFNEYLLTKELKDSTKTVYKNVFLPRLGSWLNLPLTSITPEMVIERYKQISQKHVGDANHCMRILRAIYNYADVVYSEKGLSISNPVRRMSQLKLWKRLAPRRNRLIKKHQLSQWFNIVNSFDNKVVTNYLLFMILTGFRKTEAATLLWSDIDFEQKLVTLPETRTKNGQELILPITDTHLEILNKQRGNHSQYVFNINSRPIKDIRHWLEISSDKGINFTPHDLRRTFISHAEGLPGVDFFMIKLLVNHSMKSDVTVNHYRHDDVEKLRPAMEEITNWFVSQFAAQ